MSGSVRRAHPGVGTAVLAGALAAVLAGCDGGTPFELPPLADLPADLAAVTFTAAGQPSVPHVMLELRHPDGFSGFVAVNGAGAPVWFFRTRGSPFSFTRRGNGNFVLLDSDRGLVEVTPAGAVVRELAQQERPGRRMHHDVVAADDNTVLFIAEEWQQHEGELINGEAIWEWEPESGGVVKRWSAFDHLDPVLDTGARSRSDDWLHANSIALGSRGNVLLSLHFLDQVVSIAPAFSGIESRIGGVRATIPVEDAFSGQHTAHETDDSRLLLFDNGFDRVEERYSRAVEYDVSGSTARTVWEWRPARDNWARVISSARRLPGGSTLVGFGTPRDRPVGSTGPIEVYEVGAGGDVTWHLEISGAVSSMYRATPVTSFSQP